MLDTKMCKGWATIYFWYCFQSCAIELVLSGLLNLCFWNEVSVKSYCHFLLFTINARETTAVVMYNFKGWLCEQ